MLTKTRVTANAEPTTYCGTTMERAEADVWNSLGDDEFRVRVLRELVKKARRVDSGDFEGCRYGYAQFHDALADALSDFELLAFPVADSPIFLAETVEHRGSTFVIGMKRVGRKLVPVCAELASEFRPL